MTLCVKKYMIEIVLSVGNASNAAVVDEHYIVVQEKKTNVKECVDGVETQVDSCYESR